MKRLYRDRRELLVLALTALVIVAYILRPELFEDVGFAPFGLAALAVGYFSGLLAILIGVFYTLAGLIVAVPLFSTVYAYILFSIARIHYRIMGWLTGKILKRNRRYHETKLKVKNSRVYRTLKRFFNRILRRSGIAEPHPIKLFKIKRCLSCGGDIPLDSRYCPYCNRSQ